MAQPQAGIAITASPQRVRTSGRQDPASLRADIQVLQRAVADLNRMVSILDGKLTRRVNEMLTSGTFANRPQPGTADRFYLSIDLPSGSNLSYDTGTAWVTV